MTKIYRSAVDTWLAAVLIAAPLAVIVAGAVLLQTSVAGGVLAIFVGLFVGGSIALFAVPCRYELSDATLTIRCGMLTDEISVRQISRVEKTRSVWSAPALSLKRVRISTEGGSYLISPKDRDSFIADLQERVRYATKG